MAKANENKVDVRADAVETGTGLAGATGERGVATGNAASATGELAGRPTADEPADAATGNAAGHGTHPAPFGKSTALRGVIVTLIGGSCWGFSGTCAKFLMDSYGVDPLWLVCVRQLCASVLFLAFAAAMPRDRARLIEFGRTRAGGAAGIVTMVLTALCMMANSASYIVAINLTNSATATVLQALGMLVLMVFACVGARRLPHRREVIGVVLALAGTFLLATGGDPTRLSMPLDGLGWGLFTGLSYALYSAVPAKALQRWGSPVVNGVAMLISGLILLVVVRPWEHMPNLDATGFMWLVIIIFVGTFLAFALYLQGVKDLGALRASMLGTSEPIAATVFSVLWLGTVFTPADLLGFALIIVMVYFTA